MSIKITLTEGDILLQKGEDVEIITIEETLEVRRHSPAGFNWGYGGSGPAQAALGCCMLLYGEAGQHPRVYQGFKAKYIAGLKNDDTVDEHRFATLEFDEIPPIDTVSL